MSNVARSYPLAQVRGLSLDNAAALGRAGVDTTRELLSKTGSRSKEQALARVAGIPHAEVREAVNRADLMRISGIGPTRADLFENAGVNSAKELAKRNASALAATLEKFLAAHPELNVRLPSPNTVATLVERAKALTTDPTPAQPQEVAAAALHRHIDEVLFSDHPDGASFREAVLGWRPSTEWPDVQARMHQEVQGFFAQAEAREEEGAVHFVGNLIGLYTEVSVDKASGAASRVYVEID